MTGDRTTAGTLTERLAEALYRWTTEQSAGGPARLLTRDETVLWENSLARADAVLPVVEDETAALRAALDKAHEMAAEYSKRGIENGERAEALETDLRQERAVHEQTVQRAEEAERHRDEARRELAEANFAIGRQTAALASMQKTETERDEALAAVQRVRNLHVRHDCTNHVKTSTPVPCSNHGICEGCGTPPDYPCRSLAALDQPEQSP